MDNIAHSPSDPKVVGSNQSTDIFNIICSSLHLAEITGVVPIVHDSVHCLHAVVNSAI
jgi:hypothetical protein